MAKNSNDFLKKPIGSGSGLRAHRTDALLWTWFPLRPRSARPQTQIHRSVAVRVRVRRWFFVRHCRTSSTRKLFFCCCCFDFINAIQFKYGCFQINQHVLRPVPFLFCFLEEDSFKVDWENVSSVQSRWWWTVIIFLKDIKKKKTGGDGWFTGYGGCNFVLRWLAAPMTRAKCSFPRNAFS